MIEYTVIVYDDGSKEWFVDGVRHRDGGPAVEYANGYKSWRVNGNLHREDGPAIQYPDGTVVWYLNGEHITEEEHARRTSKTKELTVQEISDLLGYNVKVVR